jgi:hypothetical protein
VITRQWVVQASPVSHGVCFGPAMAAFAVCGAARPAVSCVHEAHSMRFTFVADCPSSMRLLSTCPHGHAVAVPFRRNDLIGRMRLPLMVGWFSGSHPQRTLSPDTEGTEQDNLIGSVSSVSEPLDRLGALSLSKRLRALCGEEFSGKSVIDAG